MSADVDYYAILGVLPTAEDIVIRAAYRALAQRYHPDKFQGGLQEAETRMREINDAYEVLSDPTRRASYDQVRSRSQTSSTYFSDNDGDVPPEYDPLRADWLLALEYYPDLSAMEHRLARISWRLAYTFKAYLIDAKFFDRRASIAERMEQQFLEAYFGSNAEILHFARLLIETGNKPAARALNDAVRVLGRGVPPGRIIDRIKDRFDLHEKPPPAPPPPPPPSPEEVARRRKEDQIGVAILLAVMIFLVATAAFVAT